MGGLLHVNLRSILAKGLVSLAENRIQRLGEGLIIEEPAEVCGDDELHSFDWVRGHRRLPHRHWHRTAKAAHRHQHRLRIHALNGETYPCQVKISVQYFPSSRLEENKDIITGVVVSLTATISETALLRSVVCSASLSSKPPQLLAFGSLYWSPTFSVLGVKASASASSSYLRASFSSSVHRAHRFSLGQVVGTSSTC